MTAIIESESQHAANHYCGLGADSIPLRATVNEKQCEMRGLFMLLVIHYGTE